MMAEHWNRTRSDFNHAWLKNRLVVALGRARNVLAGAVQDDAIWNDLSALLSEWPDRKEEARRVLSAYPEAASPRQCAEAALVANLPPDAADWLADLAHQRWSEQEKPELQLSNAFDALVALDTKIRIVSTLLSDVEMSPCDDFADALEGLRAAAFHLGEVFSGLGRTRV